jgi:hypothetical protein
MPGGGVALLESRAGSACQHKNRRAAGVECRRNHVWNSDNEPRQDRRDNLDVGSAGCAPCWDQHWKTGGAVDWVHATKAVRHITRDYASLHKAANELLTNYWGQQIELLADYLGIEREMGGARLLQVLSYR